MYEPVTKIDAESTNYILNSSDPDAQTVWADFLAKYNGKGYFVYYYYSGKYYFHVYGTMVSLTFQKLDTEHPSYANYWNANSSIIQSLEVYSSRPKLYLDTSAAPDGLKSLSSVNTVIEMALPQMAFSEMELGSQLMYHQASIPMTSLAASDQTVTLTFGGNIQVTEDTLDTDAGALKRYGRVLSYNARFHFFDSVSHVDIGMPSFHYTSTGTGVTANVYVRYADSDQSELVWVGAITDHLGAADIVIAPTINAKEVIVYAPGNNQTKMIFTYRMSESSAYNYAYCIGGPTSVQQISGTATNLDNLIPFNHKPVGITNVETDAINVTEQYNPFVFRVEHSYKAPGNVIDVQPQMAGLTDVSYGRDPLSVSTERGLYNLTLGSANVLYGAFVPVSNIVTKRGGIPTEMGIFFLGDGGLWLLSGRRATLVSEALTQGPHKYVRACPGYKKLSGTDTNFSPTPVVASPVYDVSPYLSKVEFSTFVDGARLAYNRFRQEILISNSSYNYTYVLSLKYRQWFKLGRRLWQDDPGSVIVSTPGSSSGLITVLDMETEINGTIIAHMQSRPFSMGYQYAHVHRIVAMMRAKLSGLSAQVVAVGLYGSDNLQDWKLLAYAKRAGSTHVDPEGDASAPTDVPLYLSQIRTPSSARSWRYYTVCIGGNIQAGGDFPTDIGPVLVDYKPVVRRIG